ncbi:hypothetical protein QEZ52_10375 [Aliisedimentitalea scapharcae]|uniref:Phage integrase family protein n=1 Tax=Aliisedimentitalea scapharcae TaxID=1524259 RepID=A0ABZ2XXU4_9RHOB
MTKDGQSRDFPRGTMHHFGVALRPHAFRDCAATSSAGFDPEHAGITRDILGHATVDMAEKNEKRATGISRRNALQSIVENTHRSR